MTNPINFNFNTFQPPISPSSEELAWQLVNEVLKNLDEPFDTTDLTPLEIAIHLQDLELCKKLASLEGGLESQKSFEESLLMRALSESTEEIGLWLIEQGVDIHIQDARSGFNALHKAVALGKTEVAKELIKRGVPIDSVFQKPVSPHLTEKLNISFLPCTPLSLAVESQKPHMVKTLLSLGADGNFGHPFFTPFSIALCNDLDEILAVFVEQGFNLNTALFGGEFILSKLISIDQKEWIKKLLALGADPNHPNREGSFPLHQAVTNNLKDITRMLLEKGANPNLQELNDGDTPLHIASILKNEEIVKILLEYKVNVNAEDNTGETPLFKTQKNTTLSTLLIQQGANPRHINHEKRTPLHYACLFNNCETAKILIQHNASINATDSVKDTPLHMAKSEEMVELLLDAGALARVINENGITPLLLKEANSQNYLRLKKEDGGLTSTLCNLKFLGHRFSFQGTYAEGFKNTQTFLEMEASWKEFLSTQSKEFQEKYKSLSSKFLEGSSFECSKGLKLTSPIFDALKKGDLQILPLRWEKHAVVLAIKDRFVLRGNRGNGSGEKAGITIFEMEERECVDKAVIKLIDILKKEPSEDEIIQVKRANQEASLKSIQAALQDLYKQEAIQYFQNTLLEGVGLKFLTHVQQPDQESGNCTWMAAKMGLRAGLILTLLEEDNDLPNAIQQAKVIYRKWSDFDYERAIEQLTGIIHEPLIEPHIVEKLYLNILVSCADKGKISLVEKLLKVCPELDDEGNSILLSLCKRNEYGFVLHLFKKIIEGKIPPEICTMKNKQGLTPLHILMQQPIKCSSCYFVGMFFEAAGNIDLVNLTDNDGNNILHVLFSQPSGRMFNDPVGPNGSSMASILAIAANTEENCQKLLNAKNSAGVTPKELLNKLIASNDV